MCIQINLSVLYDTHSVLMQGSGALGSMDAQAQGHKSTRMSTRMHPGMHKHAWMRVHRDAHECAAPLQHLPSMLGMHPEAQERTLCLVEPWPPVQALAALLQGHDYRLRVKLLQPHVVGGTCSEPHSLFVNNGRDVADSPHCSESQQGSRAAFAQW